MSNLIKNKNIPYIHLIPIIIISIFLYKIIDNIGSFLGIIKSFFSIISPFIWAFAIAYILNPAVKYLENKFKLKRPLSLVIVYSLVLGSIILMVTIISPKIVHSISDLIKSTPDYIKETRNRIYNSSFNLKLLDRLDIDIIDKINGLITKYTTSLDEGITLAVTKAISFTSSFVKSLLGFIISIYILKDKEKLKIGFKKFLYASFKRQHVNKFLHVCREIDKVFLKYILGKAIDSLIIGILCFVGLSILRTPYSPFLSFIVGVTNMIPYFGPFIGMVPAFILTLFFSPIKAFWVLIFIFLLQQFDGLYLGPKILGGQVGLSPFWIIFSIVIGGGTFGVLGMFLGVPIIAILKTFLDNFVERRLSE